MSLKKLPETDEERLNILRAIIDQEELAESQYKVLSILEMQELRVFVTSFEGHLFVKNQAIMDKDKAVALYDDLFKNAQMYISHFIQVLLLTVIRNEIKTETLQLYGFENWDKPYMPDLSSEEAILKWGKSLMQGEAERIYRRGIPLYNPAIAKLKVHYELFEDAIQSTSIYKKNLDRLLVGMVPLRKKANELIENTWTKVEEKYGNLPYNERIIKYNVYKVRFYQRGEQLNVFN
ncbi:MAG: hypothetical protein LBU22_05860 [Dysgonamonadaceae bacterium]|jgi:hypothetical protein|nr:hypothetical protein [Dysgonamonadaceae bacterium]